MNLDVSRSIEEIQGLENSDLEGNLNLVEGLEHIEIETNGVRLHAVVAGRGQSAAVEFLAGGLPGSR